MNLDLSSRQGAAQVPGWKRRWTFLLAATGSAFGLGNIWKLPYIIGENGGGAFVLVFLLCILLIGVPIMMAETLLGRLGRANPVATMGALAVASGRSPNWALAGGLGVAAGLLIMMFYSVVAGWILTYVFTTASGSFEGLQAAAVGERFAQLRDNFSLQLLAHGVFAVVTGLIVAGGVTRGIGRAVEVLMPLLFLFILVMLGYSMANAEFLAGIRFLFVPDFSGLSADGVLVALGHAFFSLSLGMGAIMAYGAYMPGDAPIGKTIVAVALLDTLFGLMMGMVIFPLIFAHGIAPSAGPGLLFESLPIAFGNMPWGAGMGGVFFTLVLLAALTSSISLIEPGVAWLTQKFAMGRVAATTLLTGIGAAGGVLSIQSEAVFNFLDALTSRYLLPLGGMVIAIFCGWLVREDLVKGGLRMSNPLAYGWWRVSVRFAAPLGILLIFLHSFGLLGG